MVAEPNGDLRVVKYVADVSNGFKADVNVQPGGSPMKPSTALPKEGLVGYNNQRTGISSSPKQRKPLRGFNPIVVKSLSSFTQPSKTDTAFTSTSPNHSYAYYRAISDTTPNISSEFTTPVIPQKSIQVELTYKDDDTVIEKNIESVVLPEKKILQGSSTEATSTVESKNFNLQSLSYLSTEIPAARSSTTETPIQSSSSTNALYQLDNMDIPSSIIEILNQQKLNFKNVINNIPTYSTDAPTSPVTTETPVYKHDAVDHQIKNSVTTEAEGNALRDVNLPQRPMRLIGLSPIYMDHGQLQAVNENLTSPSQIPLDHIINIQYATPTPFVSGPLLGGAGPFRNIPRSVSEPSDLLPNSAPVINTLPVINSLPISAPIISQNEPKQELKPPPASLPLCNDCLLPPNYMSYPVMRFPTANNNNQKPCPPENTPYWAPYKPGFAYILMPSQIIKNNV